MIAKFSIQMIFLMVIGVVLLVMGVTDIKKKRKICSSGFLKEAKVLTSKYISKEYDDGFLMQNYYDLTLEANENGKKQKLDLKSTNEYFTGEIVKIYRDNVYGNKYHIYNGESKNIFNSLLLAFIGVLMVFIPFSTIKQQSLILTLIVLSVGIFFISSFLTVRKKNLEEITAEICGILKFEKDSPIGHRRKMLSTKNISYYPIVKYMKDGKERHMRCDVNSSHEKAFKVGKSIKLYIDIDTGSVFEMKERKIFAFIGIALIIISLYGLVISFIHL